MAKASLTLSDGTIVQIEGSPDEIAHIMNLHSGSHTNQIKASTPSQKNTQNIAGPQQRILELKSIDFFNEKRSISDIQKKLEEQGYIYALTSLSTPLIRLVKKKDLRRIKVDNIWMYINP